MDTVKTEAEELMNAIIGFAEHMLKEYGEFYPYGGAMTPDGEITMFGAEEEDDDDEMLTSQELIDILKTAFRKAAQNGDYKATAIVYDIHLSEPSNDTESDAIAISLEHMSDYSVIVVIPYVLNEGDIQYGEVLAQEGDKDIFVRH